LQPTDQHFVASLQIRSNQDLNIEPDAARTIADRQQHRCRIHHSYWLHASLKLADKDMTMCK